MEFFSFSAQFLLHNVKIMFLTGFGKLGIPTRLHFGKPECILDLGCPWTDMNKTIVPTQSWKVSSSTKMKYIFHIISWAKLSVETLIQSLDRDECLCAYRCFQVTRLRNSYVFSQKWHSVPSRFVRDKNKCILYQNNFLGHLSQ